MDVLRQRPRLLDAAVAAAVLAALLVDAEVGRHGAGISIAGVAAALAASVPLLWRRVAPTAVVAAVIPGIFLSNATLECYNTAIVPGAVALFSVGLYGHRARSLAIAVAVTPVIVAGVAITGEDVLSATTVENLAWGLLALAGGDALRWRRSAAAEERLRVEREAREREAEGDRRVAVERLRIAQEVHDVVAHAMVAINVQAGTAAHLIDEHPEQARGALREIKRVSGAALTDLRATLGLLRADDAEAPIRPAERLAELPDLALPLRAAGIEVEMSVDDAAGEVASAVGAAAYRIVQEALTNVLRHSGAERASVVVGVGATTLEVEVLDDGTVLNGHTDGSGNGLRGMRERASAIGGAVEAGHRATGGWRVHARLPLR